MSNPIGNLGTIPTLSLGGFTITDITNLKFLSGFGDSTNLRNTLRATGTSSGYVVPGGKTFRVIAILVANDTAGGNVAPGYADNDVGQNSTTAFTNPVFAFTGTTTPKQYTVSLPAVTAAAPFYAIPIKFDIPTGKYAVTQNTGTGNMQGTLVGYEF